MRLSKEAIVGLIAEFQNLTKANMNDGNCLEMKYYPKTNFQATKILVISIRWTALTAQHFGIAPTA
jgi:hypothetical protein